MLRWFVLVLLVLNGILFLWGWINDAPLEPSMPTLSSAPLTLRLVGEPVPELPHVMSAPGESPDLVGRDGEAVVRPASPGPIRVSPSADVARSSGPDSDGAMDQPLPGVGAPQPGRSEQVLREAVIERVDPDLLPEALDPLPVVIPPVQEDEPGPVHQWRQEQSGYRD